MHHRCMTLHYLEHLKIHCFNLGNLVSQHTHLITELDACHDDRCLLCFGRNKRSQLFHR